MSFFAFEKLNATGSTMPSSTSQQARYWILTIKEASWQPCLPDGVDFCKGQLEVGEGGFRHWQLIAYFKRKVRLGTVKAAFTADSHCEPTRSESAEGYVGKEETRVAGSEFCFGQKSFKRNSQKDWADVKDLIKKPGGVKNVIELYPDIGIRNIGQLQRASILLMEQPKTLDNCCGVWIYGPPGVGKSHSARDWYGSVFNKNLNKWWDGYDNQKSVLLDDVGVNESKWIGTFLKIWADKYPFQAEVKGGTLNIRPDRVIVTSNYSIEDLFCQDSVLCEAINRRFYKIFIPNKRN